MLAKVPPNVYTARDIALAAGVAESRVMQLLARGEIRAIADGSGTPVGEFISHNEAVRAFAH